MENYWVYAIAVLWVVAMGWVAYEIVFRVRRIRYTAYLRGLSDQQLSDLYTKRWLSLNADLLKDRLKMMQYVEIMRELMRRDLYTGKIVH